MRVKIGNEWFEAKVGQPIMIELTNKDKENIKNMHPEATCYAQFDNADPMTRESVIHWMNGGAIKC